MYTKSGPSCKEVATLQVAPSGFLPSSDQVRKQELTLVAIFFLTIRGRRILHAGPLNVNSAHSILQPCRWNVDLKHYNSVFFLTLLSTSPEHMTSTVACHEHGKEKNTKPDAAADRLCHPWRRRWTPEMCDSDKHNWFSLFFEKREKKKGQATVRWGNKQTQKVVKKLSTRQIFKKM